MKIYKMIKRLENAIEIKRLAKTGLINDTDSYKAEFIRLVENVK